MAAFRPTVEQTEVKSASRRHKGLKVIAFAGAGKTSTMVMVANDMCNRGKKGYYLAFNSSIVKGVEKAMPSGVTVKTFHSLAYSQVPKNITKKINNTKQLYPKTYGVDFYIDGFMVTADTTKTKTKGSETDSIYINNQKQYIVVKRALDAFFLDMTEQPQSKHIVSVCESALRVKMDDDNKNLIASRLLPNLIKIWARFQDPDDDYAISHNVYLKLWALSNPVLDVDFILFDEAQDSDRLMLDILSKQKADMFYVGDPHQQIYEWRGAVNAMDMIKLKPYYLTQSFRFGKAIADYAAVVLRYLGEKKTLTGIDKPSFIDTTTLQPTDADVILCRTNFGAIEAVIKYANHDHITVIPKNIELDHTLKLLKEIEMFRLGDGQLNTARHPIFSNFTSYDELQKFCKETSQDTTIAPTVKLYNEYGFEAICDILDGVGNVDKRRKEVVIATTAHKAKGLEWKNVLIWDDFQKMMKYDQMQTVLDGKAPTSLVGKDPIDDAEARLLYVTITRAKNKVYAANIDVLIQYLQKQENGELK